MHQGLGIAVGAESVPALREFGAQLPVVVYLAIEHRPTRAVLVADRLAACFEVYDAQPSHAKPCPPAYIEPVLVRSTVQHRRAHGLELLEVHGLRAAAHDPSYTAHGSCTFRGQTHQGLRPSSMDAVAFTALIAVRGTWIAAHPA